MKNFLLLSAILIGLLPSTVAFSADAQQTTTAAEKYALEQSIMFATSDGNFRGDGLVTRLEFTLSTINTLYRNEDFENCYSNISPSQPVSFERLFSDVQREDWYGKQLCVGMHVGLIQGDTDGNFRPFASITTAEAAKILSKAYGLLLGSDAGKSWYAAPMTALSIRGAIARSTAPENLLTRETMAHMFYTLRNVPRLAMTPMMTGMQQEEQPVPAATTPTATTPAVTEISAPSIDTGCIASIGTGSPGAALWILGQTAHPQSVERHSRRILRALVENAYRNGSFESSPQRSAGIASISGRCSELLNSRSPGAALLLRGVRAHPQSVQRPSNRQIQQEAESRMHKGGLILHPLAL